MTPRDGPFCPELWCGATCPTVWFDPDFPSFRGIDLLRWKSWATKPNWKDSFKKKGYWTFHTTYLQLFAGLHINLNVSESTFVAIFASFVRLESKTHGRVPKITWRFHKLSLEKFRHGIFPLIPEELSPLMLELFEGNDCPSCLAAHLCPDAGSWLELHESPFELWSNSWFSRLFGSPKSCGGSFFALKRFFDTKFTGLGFTTDDPSFRVLSWTLLEMTLCFLSWKKNGCGKTLRDSWRSANEEDGPTHHVWSFLWWSCHVSHCWTSALNHHFDHSFVVFKIVQLRLTLRRVCVCGKVVHMRQFINISDPFCFGMDLWLREQFPAAGLVGGLFLFNERYFPSPRPINPEQVIHPVAVQHPTKWILIR